MNTINLNYLSDYHGECCYYLDTSNNEIYKLDSMELNSGTIEFTLSPISLSSNSIEKHLKTTDLDGLIPISDVLDFLPHILNNYFQLKLIKNE